MAYPKRKRVVRCSVCSQCAEHLPLGFTSVPRLCCVQFGIDVEYDDGCTFGELGEHCTATDAPEVMLMGEHAAHGDTDEKGM